MLTLFSVKEALFKALHPFGVGHLDFRDVTIEMRPRGALIVEATSPVLAAFDLTAC
ncbi:MAG: 4-phosphopantetheinyl transferase family protein [Deltaproteobacteria bacterium]|nr:4-phosphopantetheinyl transferase family protein [Deltaproteobacteria bacterium]